MAARKIALVTGANRGIGLDVVRALIAGNVVDHVMATSRKVASADLKEYVSSRSCVGAPPRRVCARSPISPGTECIR